MRVIVLDEDPNSRETMGRFLAAWDFDAVDARSARQALTLATQQEIPIAVISDPVAGMDSYELVREFRKSGSGVETILIAQDGSPGHVTEAFRAGTYDCLSRPVDFSQLRQDLETLRDAIQRGRERKIWEEELEGEAVLEGMVGFTAPMQAVFAAIRRLAQEESPVLITGLTGTGKEMAARALHALSPRASRPLVVYRCCGVTEALAGSELFGEAIQHSPRRPRSSLRSKQQEGAGILETAGDGTVFLDEIGDLPLAIQNRLTQVFRDRRILRADDRKAVPVRARLLAASHLNLAEAARTGQFSKDLYRLLKANTIHLPSLAERPEDIPLLCQFFLKRFNQEFGKTVRGFLTAAERALLSYPWPGNVRELENVISRACLLADEDRIELRDLSLAPEEPYTWPEGFPRWREPKASPDSSGPGSPDSNKPQSSAKAGASK